MNFFSYMKRVDCKNRGSTSGPDSGSGPTDRVEGRTMDIYQYRV